MSFREATEALIEASRVACGEAKEAVCRSVSVRARARATIRESQRLRAKALALRDGVWILTGLQEPGA
jgi:hypothetical protein